MCTSLGPAATSSGSVASTAASLIPPYLTQPLVDDVLIPRQARGADVSFHLDPLNAEIGLHATPIVAKNVIIVGAAHPTGANPTKDRARPG